MDKSYKSEILESGYDKDEEIVKFEIKQNLKFYLFCSHTPCKNKK